MENLCMSSMVLYAMVALNSNKLNPSDIESVSVLKDASAEYMA